MIASCRPGLAPNQSVERWTQLVLRPYPDSVAGLALVKGSLASCEVLRRRDTRHRKEGAGEHEVCGQSFHVPLQSLETLCTAEFDLSDEGDTIGSEGLGANALAGR